MKKNKGFTLIELLVTMTIVAVLAALALVSLQGSRKGARDAKRKADLEEIRAALEMYRADRGDYPAAIYPRINSGSTVYMSTPTDPIVISSGNYYYERGGTSQTYNLCAVLESGGSTVTGCGTNGCDGRACNYKVTQP